MRRVFLSILLALIMMTSSAEKIWDLIDTPTSGINSTQYNFTLIPFYGGIGVNLGSLYYPQHDSSQLEWKRWEGKDTSSYGQMVAPWEFFYPENSLVDTDGSTYYFSGYYSDYHIIALGGAYILPFSNDSSSFMSVSSLSKELREDALNLPDDATQICIPKESISLNVQATCNSDFEFVSQSNPIYRRPFDIEVVPRVDVGNNTITEQVYSLKEYGGNVTIKIPEGTSGNMINMLAADLLLVLPYDYSKYDEGGGYFSGGLSYGNATYALADLDDYTAVVTLTYTLTFEYSYKSNYSNQVTTKTYTDTRTIVVPFSGFYSSSGSGDVRDDSISLFVNSTPEAANLDLAEQGQWITVGSINFIFNEKVYTNTNNNEDIVRIFLSSSPYPDVQGSTFRMIHENATSIITNTNSLGFTARIEGTGSNAGNISLLSSNSNSVDFDGTAYTGNIAGGKANSDKDVVKTVCNRGIINNNTITGKRHFHTFEGDIKIRFDESDILDAGIYRGYVYVHAVTEDE